MELTSEEGGNRMASPTAIGQAVTVALTPQFDRLNKVRSRGQSTRVALLPATKSKVTRHATAEVPAPRDIAFTWRRWQRQNADDHAKERLSLWRQAAIDDAGSIDVVQADG